MNISKLKQVFLAIPLIVVGLSLYIFHADALISNGANAVDLLGQYGDTNRSNPTPLYTKRGSDNTPNQYGYSGMTDVELDSVRHRLFVQDYGNNRILVYNLDASDNLLDGEADFVIGQADFHSNQTAVTANRFNNLNGMNYDSGNDRLFVADNGAHRVLVFDTSTITNGMNASYVIGQPNFTTSGVTTPDQQKIYVQNIAFDAVHQRLFVSDAQNHASRVLVFDVTPGTMSNFPMAIGILGQPDFTSNTTALDDSHFYYMRDLEYDPNNDWLYVHDRRNVGARILVFDVATTTPLESAIYVIGQPNFTTSVNSLTQNGLADLTGMSLDSGNSRLFVNDGARTLVYDVSLGNIANGMNAVNVLGQPDFITNTTAVNDKTDDNPGGLYYEPVHNKLYLPSRSNNRVLVYDVSSVTNYEPAVQILGQSDGTSATNPGFNFTKISSGDGANLWGFSSPAGSAYDPVNNRLFVTDNGNCRVVVYDLDSTHSLANRIPDYVIGQAGMGVTPDCSTVAANKLGGPHGSPVVDTKNNRLFVSDLAHRRIMVYNLASLATGMNASYVLGQPDFISNSSNTTQDGLNLPRSISYDPDGERLFVADTNNHRVMVFNVNPVTIANGSMAQNQLGQLDFVSSNNNLSQSELNNPYDVEYVALTKKLYVADQNNNRVLEFDAATTTIVDGMLATHVLGQPDFTTSNCNVTQTDLCTPAGLAYDSGSGRLYVSDSGNNRVVSYVVGYGGVAADFEPQVNVLGQPDFITNSSATTQSKMDYPVDLGIDPTTGKLAVTDQNANRIMIFDASTTVTVDPISMGVGTDGTEGGTAGSFVINTVSTSTPYIIYFTLTGSATNGTDYSTTPLSVYVPANSTTVTININSLTDTQTEGTETVTLTLASTTHFAVAPGVGNSATINITDVPSSGGSGGGGGGVVAPPAQYFNGSTYIQGTPFLNTGNNSSAEQFNLLLKQNNLPDLIGGGEPGVPKEFSNYVCQRYLREYILPGQKNNSSEVKKLQIFLNDNEGEKLEVDGTYDEADILAVKRFQAKYLDQIMAPWGVDEPTGRVFRTTTAKINLLMCAKQRGCPYFKEYLNKGDESLESVKVQDFLNIIFAPTSGYPDNALPLTKEFNSPTKSTVENFQNVYKEIVLRPWDLTSATGRWYQTTRHAANKLMNCNEGEIKLENGKVFK